MNESYYVPLGFADLIQKTNTYLEKNFALIFTLGFVSGISRFFQEGGMKELTFTNEIILEVIVNIARLLIIFLIIGNGSIQTGFRSFTSIFRLTKNQWFTIWANVQYNFANNFLAILINIIIYIILVIIVNTALFSLLEFTPILDWLKAHQLLSTRASKWPVLLFLKNISVIPITLIFETTFLIWILGKNKLAKQ